ncbi:MAG: hypothetical protein K9J30_10640 [Bacteroidales bacterium]|nr:hypothetical protein [Bacteroidales bacterium]
MVIITETSWDIEGETGEAGMEINETCTREYDDYSNYIETCTGTRKSLNSGNSCSYTAIYNWIDCSITVDIDDVGSCSDIAEYSKNYKDFQIR